MPSPNFYYGKIADIVIGSANFASKLAAEFEALGLTSEQSDAYGVVNTTLQNAYALSSVPGTRTSVAVKATGAAILAMRAAVVPLASQLIQNPAVSNAQLVSLGLQPRLAPKESQLITVVPALSVVDVRGHRIHIRVRDASGSVRGIFPGAIGAVVYSYVGPTPPSGVKGWTIEAPITRDSLIVTFKAEVPVGSRVWFAARWFNCRGMGPGCTPVKAVIDHGDSLAA